MNTIGNVYPIMGGGKPAVVRDSAGFVEAVVHDYLTEKNNTFALYKNSQFGKSHPQDDEDDLDWLMRVAEQDFEQRAGGCLLAGYLIAH